MRTRGIAVDPSVCGQMRSSADDFAGKDEESLDLFLRKRGTVRIESTKTLPAESAIKERIRSDDFLDAEIGKHDYDWLLTPPATPISPSWVSCDNQIDSTITKSRSSLKSVSTSRASKLPSSQSENCKPAKPVRSSSSNRPSFSNAHSITSRPSIPGNPSDSISSSKLPSASIPSHTRSANPSKTRPPFTSPGEEKLRHAQNPRPLTPTGRPQLPSISAVNRSTSRPSSPTRRPNSAGVSSSEKAIVSRSPSRSSVQRRRAPVLPVDFPDFSHETPPNLITKLPERPTSAGKARPGMALTVRASSNSEAIRSEFPKNTLKIQPAKKDHANLLPGIQKPAVLDPAVLQVSKTSSTENNGSGITISKMSLDMALRHMDIRQSMGETRANSNFPHTIRSQNAPRSRPTPRSVPISLLTNEELSMAVKPINKESLFSKDCNYNLLNSSLDDSMLLKEDLTSANWAHRFKEKADQSSGFKQHLSSQ